MSSHTLANQEQFDLLCLARSSIEQGLAVNKVKKPDLSRLPASLSSIQASFVTLNLNNQLRGCIGSLQAYQPLAFDVMKNAYSAAFRDPRFNPISSARELALVKIQISILSANEELRFESEDDLLQQIRPHIDGLIIKDGSKQGTFLPIVWNSFPDTKQFFSALKRKAGLPIDHWSDTLKCFRYTTFCFSDEEVHPEKKVAP